MKLLAIETSTALASVALQVGNDVLVAEQEGVRQHAISLLPMTEGLLSSAGIHFSQLDGIIFGRGPGSFTGLRVACSIAKAFAFAHDLPLFPVSGLATIACEAFEKYQDAPALCKVIAILDARMQQVYWGAFTKDSLQAIEQVSDPQEVKETSNDALIWAGVGLEEYGSLFPAPLLERTLHQDTLLPHARTMLRVVQAHAIEPVDAAQALPVYIRNQVTQGESHG